MTSCTALKDPDEGSIEKIETIKQNSLNLSKFHQSSPKFKYSSKIIKR